MAAAERDTQKYTDRGRQRRERERGRERGENKKERNTGRRETEPCEWGSEERLFENPTREGRRMLSCQHC
jgi:hypothetical protein